MKTGFAILSLSALLVLGLSSDLCAKDIKVLNQANLSGVAGSYPEYGWGFMDGIEYVNKAGGINGKPITAILEDVEYNVPKAVATFTRYSASEPPDELLMVIGYQTGVLKALIDKVNKEQKIPWVDGSYSTELFGPEGGPSKYPYYFSMGATYGDQMKVLLRWIKKDYKGSGNPKLALVYSPTEWGRDPLAVGKAYAKKIGVDVVDEEEVSFSATDVTTQVTNIRRAKAKYVIFHGFAGPTPVTPIFLKTARQYLKNAVILGTHYTTSINTFYSAGDAADGMIGAACGPMPTEDNPINRLARQLEKEHNRVVKDSYLYAEAVTHALLIKESWTAADNAGSLTRDGIKTAIENLKWDFMGRFGGRTVSYKTHTIPLVKIFKAHAKEKKWIPITDWMDPNAE
jgi:branched-chain amino acid transport system substrate-binding protein